MKKLISAILLSTLIISSFSPGVSAEEAAKNDSFYVSVNKILKEGNSHINVIYPLFKGFSSAEKINELNLNNSIDSIGNINYIYSSLINEMNYQQNQGNDYGKISTNLESDFIYNRSGNIMSVITAESVYSGGAHDLYTLYSYTANTQKNELYTFESLFKPKSDYKKIIENKINTMIDKEKDLYFDGAKKSVAEKNGNFKFYIDGSDIVIYFDLYDLRPYAGGIPKFRIPAKDLKNLLKEEIYSQLVNAAATKPVRFNGKSIDMPYKTFEQNYSLMVPLKFFAELLGYKVGWDPQKGASVAGGYIKNNVNSYYTEESKGKPYRLSSAPKIVDKIMYVPVEYFSEVLKKDVKYDGELIKIYKNNLSTEEQMANDIFSKQMVDFIAPDSAQSCAEMYAKAFKERKGAIQYALLSDELKAIKWQEYKDLNWVTGVSSPWVSGYEIKNTGKDTFDIVFHWAITGDQVPDSKTSITVGRKPGEEYWQITSLKEQYN